MISSNTIRRRKRKKIKEIKKKYNLSAEKASELHEKNIQKENIHTYGKL